MQIVLRGSKGSRINREPHLKGSRRPRKKVSRSLRNDLATKTSRCRCEGDSPLRRRGCSTKPSRGSGEVLLNPSWRGVLANPSRCLHEAFTQWARRGAVAKSLRGFCERFVKTSRALKASRRDREAFTKPSRSLHPSPCEFRGAFLKGLQSARGVFFWKRFVK